MTTGPAVAIGTMQTAVDLDVDDPEPPTQQLEPEAEDEDLDLAEETRRYEQDRQRFGVDAVAFYVPYHCGGAAAWGIYFVEETFTGLVARARAHLRIAGAPRSDWTWIAWATKRAVLAHEHFHFRVEFGATHAEIATRNDELYLGYLRLGRSGTALNEPALTEEALATAYEVAHANRQSGDLASFLGDESKGIPGYTDYDKYLSPRDKGGGLQVLLEAIVGYPVPNGELIARPISREYESSVPTRLLLASHRSAAAEAIFLRTIQLPVDLVRKDAKRRGADVRPGSSHPFVIRFKGKSVPLKRGWSDRRVPYHVVRQLAGLFGLDAGSYCEQVMRP
jgi:hypothetical protein